MIIFLVIVGIVILYICMSGSSGGAKGFTQKKWTPDDEIRHLSWSEPQQGNVWSSFYYFLQIGEVLSKYSYDTIGADVVIYTGNTSQEKKGDYYILFSDFEDALEKYGNIPYIHRFTYHEFGRVFSGNDINACNSILNFVEYGLREEILKRVPHAAQIEVINRTNDSMQPNMWVRVRFEEKWGIK